LLVHKGRVLQEFANSFVRGKLADGPLRQLTCWPSLRLTLELLLTKLLLATSLSLLLADDCSMQREDYRCYAKALQSSLHLSVTQPVVDTRQLRFAASRFNKKRNK
jgi:hypothetical protein